MTVPTAAVQAGQSHTRTLELVIEQRAGEPQTDEQGRRIYWARTYAYGQTDRHGTTLTRGALAGTQPGVPVLVSHEREQLAVGVIVAVEDRLDGLWAGFVFDQDDPEARRVERKVAGGFVRAVSIGFTVPLDFDPERDVTLREDGVLEFHRVDLVELSLVNVPSSTGALIDLARSLGEDPGDMARLLGVDEVDLDPDSELERLSGLVETLEARVAALEGPTAPEDDVVDQPPADDEQAPTRAHSAIRRALLFDRRGR